MESLNQSSRYPAQNLKYKNFVNVWNWFRHAISSNNISKRTSILYYVYVRRVCAGFGGGGGVGGGKLNDNLVWQRIFRANMKLRILNVIWYYYSICKHHMHDGIYFSL